MSDPPVLTVVGAGPGVGAAVARRFAGEGYAVGLIARNRSRLDELVTALRDGGATAAAETADVRDGRQLRGGLRRLAEQLGPTEVLCFSPLPTLDWIKPVVDTTDGDLREAFALNVAGAAVAVGEVVPAMRAARRGTLLFTTGSGGLDPDADRAVSGVITTAVGVYVGMLHEALAPEGVHVNHTVIVGPIGRDAGHHPDTVAEHLYRRHVRRDEARTTVR